VTAPVYEVHVPLPDNLQRTLEAPVTEVVYYKTDDREVNPDAKPAAETQELVQRLGWLVEELQVQGLIALSWGIAVEDGTRGVYICGWMSVEVRSFARACCSLSSLSFRSCKKS
jgi:hypothetical protein